MKPTGAPWGLHENTMDKNNACERPMGDPWEFVGPVLTHGSSMGILREQYTSNSRKTHGGLMGDSSEFYGPTLQV